ncbi:MAG: sigma-70 family RNA polymerase sigma factor [Bryobacterales bacterium]|nr:sigma-70 family RNA polymerase sigma factor [Bryobacterales bacterium]
MMLTPEVTNFPATAWAFEEKEDFETTDRVWEHEEAETTAAPMSQEQYGEAFRQGYPLTLRFLLSRGAAADIAEEMAQAAWAKGWECRAQLQRPHMIGAWVNSIAKNMLKNRLRSEQRLEALTEASQSDGITAMSVDMKSILNRCGERDSAILRSFYVEGYTTEEIATKVGLTPVAVRVRMLRLRNALRTQLTVVKEAA